MRTSRWSTDETSWKGGRSDGAPLAAGSGSGNINTSDNGRQVRVGSSSAWQTDSGASRPARMPAKISGPSHGTIEAEVGHSRHDVRFVHQPFPGVAAELDLGPIREYRTGCSVAVRHEDIEVSWLVSQKIRHVPAAPDRARIINRWRHRISLLVADAYYCCCNICKNRKHRQAVFVNTGKTDSPQPT